MSVTKQDSREVIVGGKGKTKASAFASALSTIQSTIMKNTTDVLMRIEPKDIEILEATEEKYTERFLFFFFPRERQNYEVRLRVIVEVTIIEVEKIKFQSK